jgi:Spy/CpxP family protein refolding chaperone
MRWLTLGTASVALTLSLLAAGCGGSVVAEGPTVTAEGAATKAPLVVSTHGHVKLVADALSEVPLRADQRALIEKLAADADGRQGAVHAARQDLLLALADQVAAGKVDRAALQPKVDAVGAAALGVQTADRAALAELHDVLDSTQRGQFADALIAQFHGHGHGMHGGHGSWKERWADLKLTDEQTAQIETILHDSFASHHGDWKGGMDHSQGVLDAFRSDAFAPESLAPATDVQAKSAEMHGRMIDLAERVLPLLTPEQRAIAATKLHERASGEEKPGEPLF